LRQLFERNVLRPNIRRFISRSSDQVIARLIRQLHHTEIRGVAKSYTNYSLGILDAKGELHLLATQDLKKIDFDSKSIMPGDYAQRLTPSEVENVLAFLSRQSMADRIPQ
jgi:hypothetical protein